MKSVVTVLLLLLLLACGDPVAPVVVSVVPPAAEPLPSTPCPECSGSGVSARTGDGRDCLLCDGEGVCPACAGDGQDREGRCAACDGKGRCPGCGGDGRVSRVAGDIGPFGAPLPGQCAFCRYGQGICPGCNGKGERASGRACAQCEGERWCAVCRGLGTDGWCGGTGVCPTCRGHGGFRDGQPVTEWPPLRAVLPDGTVTEVRLLSASGTYLSWERGAEDGVRRETVLMRDVDPVTAIQALRRSAATPEERLAIAEFALERGGHFLYVARSEIAAVGTGAQGLSARALVSRVEHAWREFVAAGATNDDGELDASPAARARKEAAEAGRFTRRLSRARSWTVRAEALLSRTEGDLTERLRALRAAEEAWQLATRAVNGAPSSVDIAPAVALGKQARYLRSRALVAAADVLLAAGRPGRARAVAMLALSVEPQDEGVRKFVSVVEEALARARTKEETR